MIYKPDGIAEWREATITEVSAGSMWVTLYDGTVKKIEKRKVEIVREQQ
jgi:hypothetical protein